MGRLLSEEVLTNRRYGRPFSHLIQYLTDKYNIHRSDARRLVLDIFNYVVVELIQGGGSFTIPRFGKFVVREQQDQHGRAWPRLYINMQNVKPGTRMYDRQDNEWVPPEVEGEIVQLLDEYAVVEDGPDLETIYETPRYTGEGFKWGKRREELEELDGGHSDDEDEELLDEYDD